MNRLPGTPPRLTAMVLLLLAVRPPLRATFSIVAVDPETGEIGSAGASCIAGVIFISDIVRGIGAIHTQALGIDANKVLARQRMLSGDSPQEIMDYLATHDPENQPGIRQFGAVDFRDGVPRSASYTGANTIDYAGHLNGPTYAIQGNILLGREILTGMEAAFLGMEGTLADKLMAALQAANVPAADTRCPTRPSISAFVRVARPDDREPAFHLDLNVDDTASNQNPIDLLQGLFDEWKLLPTAAFTASAESGEDPLEVAFDASSSSAVAGATIADYTWDFGDGETAGEPAVSHSFLLPGRYTIRLEVRDSNGRAREARREVLVSLRAGSADPWNVADIGSVSTTGAARFEDGCLTAAGGGQGFRGNADRGHFAYLARHGSFLLAARVSALRGDQGAAGAGLMLRAGTEAGSPFAAVFVERTLEQHNVRLRYRQTPGAGALVETGSPVVPPEAWIRLRRAGDSIVGESSSDGTNWLPVAEVVTALPAAVLAGVATATFSSAPAARSAARLCDISFEDLAETATLRRGDANGSGIVDISDAVHTLAKLFLEGGDHACADAADSNDDGKIDIADPVTTLGHLFQGTAGIAAPGPEACGSDPSEDGLAACEGECR
jgi:uncharacterized Ntn-hydrolase superfamily protein